MRRSSFNLNFNLIVGFQVFKTRSYSTGFSVLLQSQPYRRRVHKSSGHTPRLFKVVRWWFSGDHSSCPPHLSKGGLVMLVVSSLLSSPLFTLFTVQYYPTNVPHPGDCRVVALCVVALSRYGGRYGGLYLIGLI